MDSLLLSHTIEALIKLIQQSFQIEVRILSSSQEAQWQISHRGDKPLPTIRTMNGLENYILLKLQLNDRHYGTLVVGPTLESPFNESRALSNLYDSPLTEKERAMWLRNLQQLPVISRLQLFHISLLVHYLFYQEQLQLSDIMEHNLKSDSQWMEPRSLELSVSDRRSKLALHMEPLQEKLLLQHIRNGDRAGLLQAMNALKTEQLGILSKKSYLRSLKNLSYCSITLATRAAIEAGLFWEKAYTLSDLHIQHIEELREVPLVENAHRKALLDFADQVSKNRQQSVSSYVAVCQNYIFNHLYDVISLPELAQLAGLNPNYLSQLFKRETGISVTQFIQQERMKEAVSLLTLTEEPITGISSRLGYYDQSYFIKVFKKHTGITPKQYRMRKATPLT